MSRNLRQFVWTCRDGCLEDVRRLDDELRPTTEELRACDPRALLFACTQGHTDIAEWLTERFQLTREDLWPWENDTLRSTCRSGHLETAQWIVARFGLTPADVADDTIQWACEYGHIGVARWLMDWLEPPLAKRAEILSRVGNSEEGLPDGVQNLFETWEAPPGPGDKPALSTD